MPDLGGGCAVAGQERGAHRARARWPTTGESIEDWAGWLLAEPDRRGTWSFATAWQKAHGALDHDERLLPRTPFVLGGDYTDDNLVAEDAATAMRIRGPVARGIHDLPEGATVRLDPA